MNCLIPTFGTLSDNQIEKINANSYIVSFKQNEPIFRQHAPVSHIFFLKSGLLKIYREDYKKRIIVSIYQSCNYVGLISSFSSKVYDYSASALMDCEIVLTDINIFKSVMEENGKFSLYLMNIVCKQGLRIYDKLITISHKQIPGRIAGMLLFFSQIIFKSPLFEIPLSRQEFADLISTTKESISRTLTEFKNDRIIEMDDRKIEIKSFEILKRLEQIG